MLSTLEKVKLSKNGDEFYTEYYGRTGGDIFNVSPWGAVVNKSTMKQSPIYSDLPAALNRVLTWMRQSHRQEKIPNGRRYSLTLNNLNRRKPELDLTPDQPRSRATLCALTWCFAVASRGFGY